MADDVITPEQISHGRIVRDEDLPGLAAQWLAAGYDSPLLRDLAGLTRREAMEARQLLPEVIAELGHPIMMSDFPYEYLPWRGYWEGIWWAVDQMDKTHSPFASAQYVLEILGDVPDLWEPDHGSELMQRLRDWDETRRRPSRRRRPDPRPSAFMRATSLRSARAPNRPRPERPCRRYRAALAQPLRPRSAWSRDVRELLSRIGG